MYRFNAHGNVVASVHANDGSANFGICAPAALNMTVPFSNALITSSYVIRASSNDSPRGCETSVTYQLLQKLYFCIESNCYNHSKK
jgi:hypothetical protein